MQGSTAWGGAARPAALTPMSPAGMCQPPGTREQGGGGGTRGSLCSPWESRGRLAARGRPWAGPVVLREDFDPSPWEAEHPGTCRCSCPVVRSPQRRCGLSCPDLWIPSTGPWQTRGQRPHFSLTGLNLLMSFHLNQWWKQLDLFSISAVGSKKKINLFSISSNSGKKRNLAISR